MFGTGEGFTADLITAGQMSAERIQAHTITARELRSDAGQSLDLSSNKSILLTVQNAQQEIMDNIDSLVADRLSILIESTSPFLSNSVASITLRARVWSGSDEVTDTINAERFNWYREGGSSDSDAAWNAAHKGMKQVTVARGDVLRQAVFRCELTEEE